MPDSDEDSEEEDVEDSFSERTTAAMPVLEEGGVVRVDFGGDGVDVVVAVVFEDPKLRAKLTPMLNSSTEELPAFFRFNAFATLLGVVVPLTGP